MASKSKRRRKVLGASCILAALIIAGSSFAWFTSKDEVTNRLSASADYGVSVTETFTPPTEWVPGQEVNKDVYAVNTGNVAAFVKESISNKLTITTETLSNTAPSTLNNSDYRILGTAYTTSTDVNNLTTITTDEVTALEAGSVVAYAPLQGAATSLASNIIGGTIVAVDGTTTNALVPASTTAGDPNNSTSNGVTTGGTSFLPKTTGLYIFRRDVDKTNSTSANTTESYTYAGYYYVAKSSDTGGEGTYYKVDQDALNTAIKNDNTLTKGENGIFNNAYKNTGTAPAVNIEVDQAITPISGAAIYVKPKTQVVEPTLKYTAGSSNNGTITASYYGAVDSVTIGTATYTQGASSWSNLDTAISSLTGDDKTNAEKAKELALRDDVIINIALVNNGTGASKWTEDSTNSTTTKVDFYYNDILKSGLTSAQLVESVSLDNSVTQYAYTNFDYDIIVGLKSAQVLYAEDGTKVLTNAVAADNDFTLVPTGGTATDPAQTNVIQIANDTTALTWGARS